jgi:hypothetical protein
MGVDAVTVVPNNEFPKLHGNNFLSDVCWSFPWAFFFCYGSVYLVMKSHFRRGEQVSAVGSIRAMLNQVLHCTIPNDVSSWSVWACTLGGFGQIWQNLWYLKCSWWWLFCHHPSLAPCQGTETLPAFQRICCVLSHLLMCKSPPMDYPVHTHIRKRYRQNCGTRRKKKI